MRPSNTGSTIAALAFCLFGMGACGAEPDDAAPPSTAFTSVVAQAEEAPAAEATAVTPTAAAAPAAALTCSVNPEGVSTLDCDGDAANGCEVDPYSDAQNCGACGNACSTGFACIQKRCCNPETRECE